MVQRLIHSVVGFFLFPNHPLQVLGEGSISFFLFPAHLPIPKTNILERARGGEGVLIKAGGGRSEGKWGMTILCVCTRGEKAFLRKAGAAGMEEHGAEQEPWPRAATDLGGNKSRIWMKTRQCQPTFRALHSVRFDRGPNSAPFEVHGRAAFDCGRSKPRPEAQVLEPQSQWRLNSSAISAGFMQMLPNEEDGLAS